MPKSAAPRPSLTRNLLSQIAHDYPDFTLKPGARFTWKPPKTIVYEPETAYPPLYFALLTLHELGHAVSKHKDYKTTVERLKIESEAWSAARRLFIKYQKSDILPANWAWDTDFVENHLDTYRDWLHTKTTCKTCGLTMYQTPDGSYHCPFCDTAA